MTIRISRLHHPVTALGPGVRAGVWVQGCGIGCPGCVSRDTWDHTAGTDLTVGGVIDWLRSLCGHHGGLDGVTISGGEPTEQLEALFELATGIADLRRDGTFTGDLLCYTGLDDDEFHAVCPWADELIDAVITGPFRITEPTTLLWRGSANQRLIPLTQRGRDRYSDYISASAAVPPLQVAVHEGQVWMIGIPRRGDLQRLESMLGRNGVELQEVSWRPQ